METSSANSKNDKIKTLTKLGGSQLQFEVPLSWSINKFKCLLTSQIPALNFDEFELCHNGQLVRGTHCLHEIASPKQVKQKLEIEIIKRKSEIKLSQYYRKSMGTFMKISKFNNQPVLNVGYQKYRNIAHAQRQQGGGNAQNNEIDLNQIPDDDQLPENANAVNFLYRALRLLGMYLLLILIYDYGKFYQIAIIASIILIYYAIQFYVRYRQRKLQNNTRARPAANAANHNAQAPNLVNNNAQVLNPDNNDDTNHAQESGPIGSTQNMQEPKRREGQATIYMYKCLQIIFCFLFTFFPNLTIDMHLQLNRELIEQARRHVNKLIPHSYPPQLQPNHN